MPNYATPGWGPPAARVIQLDDVDEASALFENWNGRFEQISRGRFAGTLEVTRGKLARIIRIRANQRARIRGHDGAGLVSVYPVTERNAGSLWRSRRFTPGQIIILGVEGEADHYSAQTTFNLGFAMEPFELERAAKAITGKDVPSLPKTWAVRSPPPEAVKNLNLQLANLLSMGLADPSFLATPEGDRLEQDCVQALVAAIYLTAEPQSKLSLPARTLLVCRGEELMRSRLGDRFGSIDLCRELGVSGRTLRLAFGERYGLGPMAYFKTLRLNAVRARLRSDTEISVAAAAGEFGFYHLGNFAADYRRLFGESPSKSRRPGSAPTTPPDTDARH